MLLYDMPFNCSLRSLYETQVGESLSTTLHLAPNPPPPSPPALQSHHIAHDFCSFPFQDFLSSRHLRTCVKHVDGGHI